MLGYTVIKEKIQASARMEKETSPDRECVQETICLCSEGVESKRGIFSRGDFRWFAERKRGDCRRVFPTF